uniref:Uncharacterized protein n=1 Tax=Anguilla anguilla TaxID=7936 RepID=A0A0E9WWJ2_ANGAN
MMEINSNKILVVDRFAKYLRIQVIGLLPACTCLRLAKIIIIFKCFINIE